MSIAEREALKLACTLLRKIIRDQAGPSYPGRMHRLRNEQLPELLRVIQEGLGEKNPKLLENQG